MFSFKTIQLLNLTLAALTSSSLSTNVAAAAAASNNNKKSLSLIHNDAVMNAAAGVGLGGGAASSIRGGAPRLLKEPEEDIEDDGGDDEGEEESEQPSVEQDEPSVASAEDDSKDGVSGRSGRVAAPSVRECSSEQDRDGEVEFECKASMEDATSEIKDKIKFKVGATKGDFLKIKVEYETEIEDIATDVEIETETQYTLVYDRIVEYRKRGTAADNHFEWDSDEIVATWSLDTWGSMSPLETNGDQMTFSATDGVATFTFTIAQTDSMDLTTNKMKIDFLLENYPWDAQGDTYVALISHIETERKTEVDGADGEEDQVSEVTIDFQEAVNTIGFVPFGDYSWAATAEATVFSSDVVNGTDSGAVDVAVGRQATIEDGGDNNSTGLVGLSAETTTETVSVIASRGPVNAGVDYTEIAFSFVGAAQGADRIFWDPEAGVGYQAASSAARVVGSMAVVAAASLALVFGF